MRRLALARAPEHPLCETVRTAGWEPLSHACTRTEATGAPPPEDPAELDGAVFLSPAGVSCALPFLPELLPCLATGPGTAAVLEDEGLRVLLPEEPSAEGLMELVQERFPSGGRFLLVRAERGRGLLERISEGTPWSFVPWITHREAAIRPLPPLPPCEALLALSPLQAELLGPQAGPRLRLAWGRSAAAAFASVGYPALAFCEPRPDALVRMLTTIQE